MFAQIKKSFCDQTHITQAIEKMFVKKIVKNWVNC